MLPSDITRSDQNTSNSQYPMHIIIQCILKFFILLFIPIALVQDAWVVGTYNNELIFCGLSHTTINGNIIEYNTTCTEQTRQWACDLYITSYNTKICIIVYYSLYALSSLFTLLQLFTKKDYYNIELNISILFNIFLYSTLLYFANNIPHKFDNTLVEYESSFGLVFICNIVNIIHTLLLVIYTFHKDCIYDFITTTYDKFESFNTPNKCLSIILTLQSLFTFPLFLKHIFWQNFIQIFGLLWLYYKHNFLYNFYIILTIISIFIDTFVISMMKQTQYETNSEMFVNTLYIILFISRFIAIGFIYIGKYIELNTLTEQPTPKEPGLRKHIKSVQAQNRILKNIEKNNIEEPTPPTMGKFTIN